MDLPCRGQPTQPESQGRIRLTSLGSPNHVRYSRLKRVLPALRQENLGVKGQTKEILERVSGRSLARNRLIAEPQKLAPGLDVISSGLKSTKTASCTLQTISARYHDPTWS